MKSVIVIDDEYYTRKALVRTIDWPIHDFDIIGEADNGRRGLDMIVKLKPDIVIVDINMPIMDGMELIHRLRQEAIKTKIIILTGYNDFEHAKKAIKYSVSDYLLKPIVEEELLASLTKVAKEIDMERHKASRLEESLSVLRRDFLNNLVLGKYDDAGIINNYFSNFNLSVGNAIRVIVLLSDEVLNIKGHEIANICKVIFPVNTGIVCWRMGSNKWGIMISSQEHKSLSNSEIKVSIESLWRWLDHRKEGKDQIQIRCGKTVSSLIEIQDSYKTSSVLRASDKDKNIHLYKEEAGSAKLLVSDIKLYITQELSNPELNISGIVEEMNFNYHYICKVFKQVTGISLGDYIIDCRMKKAKELIDGGINKVNYIAAECGYNDTGYFGKAFKKHYGISPKQMMKQLG